VRPKKHFGRNEANQAIFFHPDCHAAMLHVLAQLSVPEFHRVSHFGSRTVPPVGNFTLP